MATQITVGTASGNKVLTGVTVGTSSGNKAVTEVWVGTSTGNKLVFGSADVTPNAVNWANTSTSDPQSNANQTINGCDTSITISATNSGAGVLQYSLDGAAFVTYSGPFSVNAQTGQTLRWQLSGATSGTITVINDSDASTTLDTFTYALPI